MLRHPPTLPTAHAALYCITWQVRLPEHPSDQKISNARRYFPPPYPYLTPVAIMAAVAVSSPAVCPDATWAEQIKKLDDEVVTFEFEPPGSNSDRVRTWRLERGSNSNRVRTWRLERGSNSNRIRTWRFERSSNSNRVRTWRFERGSNSNRVRTARFELESSSNLAVRTRFGPRGAS